MTITNGDVLKLTLEYLYPGAGTALNVFHYAYLGADIEDSEAVAALLDWAETEWGATWAGVAATTAELANAIFEVVDVNGDVLANLGTEAINIAGTNGGDVEAAAVSAYLSANTATPGVRGSKYVPGIASASITDGTFVAGSAAQLALLLLDYLATVNVSAGNNLFPVVRSTKLLGFPRLITAGTINLLPAYQRRRKQGVGI